MGSEGGTQHLLHATPGPPFMLAARVESAAIPSGRGDIAWEL
jgi:hypothetical protein